MELTLDYKKSVEQNASAYFDKAKKAKSKAEGAREAVERMQKKLEKVREETELAVERAKPKVQRKQQWFEKFRWFYSSEGFLVIGGRDATSNEIVIKKHTDADDLVFHTDMAGSPFFVIKANSADSKIGQASIDETAIATASLSRAWRNGLTTLDVFHVKPDQVSKEANPGEYMPKGAFMIRGKTTYHKPVLGMAIGIKPVESENAGGTNDTGADNVDGVENEDRNGVMMCAPLASIQKYTDKFLLIKQGKNKPSDAAKKIRAKLGGDLDEIIKLLPSGTMDIETYGRDPRAARARKAKKRKSKN